MKKIVRNQLISQKPATYFFLKSKDVQMENGVTFITLFASLAREITFITNRQEKTQLETLWVEINDIQTECATEKVKALPNCSDNYEVSEKVFQHLFQLSKSCPDELHGVIPYYVKATRNVFVPWQELEQAWENR
jgi:hypothetical protein